MDRQIVYPGAIPLETDLLNTNKNAMIGLSKLAAAILGTSTFLNGLACTPTGPASLQVYVAPGEIYSLQNMDGTAYSSIAADTTHAILKQGISLDQLTLSCPAPVTAGQSVNYLIQVAYQDTDSGAVVLPYYNSSNPSQAYAGPANSGTAQNTVRKGVCAVSAKAGVAATTGTQTTPAPDAGYIGAYVVTVAYGQTQITAPNISTYAGAPLIPAGGLIVGGLQQNACISSVAGGTADALTGSFFPGITALPASGAGLLTLYVRPTAANATTTPTFTPNSGVIAAKQIVKGAGSALAAGDIAGAGHWIELQYDPTLDKWVLLNPATGVAAPTVPSGTVIYVAQSTPPAGYLKANGAAVSRSTYSALFAALVTGAGFAAQNFTVTIATPGVFTKAAHGFSGGERLRLSTTGALPTGLNNSTDYFVEVIDANTYYLNTSAYVGGTRVATSGSQSGTHSYTQSWFGLGDGSTTFNLPDLRGEFLRGWDDSRGVDSGRAFGTAQKPTFHSIGAGPTADGVTDYSASNGGTAAAQDFGLDSAALTDYPNARIGGPSSAIAPVTPTLSDASYGAVRPRNVGMLACIKY